MAASLTDNAKVLYANWFKSISGETHQARGAARCLLSLHRF
jgi:hypothetical protein